jgi:hypothetical protein
VPSKVSAASEMGVSRQPTGLSGPSERERQRERRRGRPGGGASGPAGRLEDVKKVLTAALTSTLTSKCLAPLDVRHGGST